MWLEVQREQECFPDFGHPLRGERRHERAEAASGNRLDVIEVDGAWLGHAVVRAERDLGRIPRTVLVIGATVASPRYSRTESRVRTTTGRFSSGRANAYHRTSPRLSRATPAPSTVVELAGLNRPRLVALAVQAFFLERGEAREGVAQGVPREGGTALPEPARGPVHAVDEPLVEGHLHGSHEAIL